MMDDYLYFITMVEKGSISKAADELYISQPALSKYLKKLEAKVGYSLINRETRPLSLTNEGKIFYEFIQHNIEMQKKLEKNLSNASNKITGTVNVGLTVWRSSIILPLVFPEFNNMYPEIKVNLFEGSHQYLMSMLNSGHTDFSLMHLPNSFSGLRYDSLIGEDVLLVVNINNPILNNVNFNKNIINSLSVREFEIFKNEKFILLKKGHNIRELTDFFFRFIDIEPEVVLNTSNIVTAMNIVNLGYGVTFAPGLVFQSSYRYMDLIHFKIDSALLHWDIAFAYREDSPLSFASKMFINFTKNVIAGCLNNE